VATHPLRVLLAEDNAINQQLAVHLLEKHGHRVVVVGNGKQAVDALERGPFDLVRIDVQMPEMGGFEATAHIRDRERVKGGHVPIVALTAHAMKGDRERCLQAGMDDYLSKPIAAADLRRVLANVAAAVELSAPVRPSGSAAQKLRTAPPSWSGSVAKWTCCTRRSTSSWRRVRGCCAGCRKPWAGATVPP
jgi:CheY-like chemotaxis protein